MTTPTPSPVNAYVVTGAVGDGVADDRAAIQTQLDAAYNAGGGTVVIPPGLTYGVSSYLSVRSRTTIWAYGATIKSIGVNDGPLYNFLPTEVFPGFEGHGDITVLGGVWDGNAADGTTGTVTATTDTLGFFHGRNITVRDATIRNTSSAHGIEFNSVDGGLIDNCRFEGFRDNSPAHNRASSEAIQLDIAKAGSSPIGAFDNTTSRSITVRGCYFGPSERLGAFGRAVGSHSVAAGAYYDDLHIVDNAITGCAAEGIHGYGWRHAVISGNTVRSSALTAIKVTIPDPAAVGYALTPHSVSITGNTIDGCNESGIRVIGWPTAKIGTVNVSGNTVRSTGDGNGIHTEHCTNPAISGNTVDGTGTTGILAQYCNGATVTGNAIRAAGSQGINLAGGSGGVASGNTVEACGANGLFVGSGSDGETFGKDILLANNLINRPGAAGIRLSTSATRCTITGNKIREGSTTTVGISLHASATGCVIAGNDLSGNGWAAATALSLSTAAPVLDWAGGKTSPGHNRI